MLKLKLFEGVGQNYKRIILDSKIVNLYKRRPHVFHTNIPQIREQMYGPEIS